MCKIQVGLSALVVGLVILALAITSTTRTANAQGTDPLGSLRSSLGSAQGIDPLDSLRSSIDSSTIKMKNEADALISEIQATDLNNTGNVQDLIEKVYYYEGEVSVEGGGTYRYLHDVQDALLTKIKETGEAGFIVPELAAIDSFAANAEQSKLENPTVNVFDPSNISQQPPSNISQQLQQQQQQPLPPPPSNISQQLQQQPQQQPLPPPSNISQQVQQQPLPPPSNISQQVQQQPQLHLDEAIKALQAGDTAGANVHMTEADKIIQEGEAKMHLGEAIKALESGDAAGAETHAQMAQDSQQQPPSNISQQQLQLQQQQPLPSPPSNISQQQLQLQQPLSGEVMQQQQPLYQQLPLAQQQQPSSIYQQPTAQVPSTIQQLPAQSLMQTTPLTQSSLQNTPAQLYGIPSTSATIEPQLSALPPTATTFHLCYLL